MSEELGATPAEGTPTTDTAGGFDMSPVLDRVNELASSIDTRFGAIEQRLPEQQAPAEADPWDDLRQYFEEPQQPDYQQQPQQIPLDQLQQTVEARIQAGIQEGLTPIQAEFQQFQAERAAERLGQMIPALANTPENAENRQRAFQLVTSSLQNYPTAIANQLAADPNYIAAQWKAAEADRLAAGQAPASETVPTLEPAGGATPGGTETSPLDQAFAGMPQRKALGSGWY